MIHEAKNEFCVVAEYTNGDRFCIAKFMHEEDARRYKRSRKKKDYVVYRVFERRDRTDGVKWSELK